MQRVKKVSFYLIFEPLSHVNGTPLSSMTIKDSVYRYRQLGMQLQVVVYNESVLHVCSLARCRDETGVVPLQDELGLSSHLDHRAKV